jgi:formylglycine-generating enzyme required for sulfatase activity
VTTVATPGRGREPVWRHAAGSAAIAAWIGCLAVDLTAQASPRQTMPATSARAPAASLKWVRIPAGTFDMGCSPRDRNCRSNEEPRHAVTISRAFDMMATEVTVADYRRYAAASGQRLPGQPIWNADSHPVVNVTWDEMHAFCSWAGGRLPTEAEWEYGARAGATTAFPWGARFSDQLTNGFGQEGKDRWKETAPAGSFPPNAFGLFDMIGNVWEFVADWYSGDAYDRPPPRDPVGPEQGVERVLRGGSWDNEPRSLRVSYRIMLRPEARRNLYVGGRCARDASQ